MLAQIHERWYILRNYFDDKTCWECLRIELRRKLRVKLRRKVLFKTLLPNKKPKIDTSNYVSVSFALDLCKIDQLRSAYYANILRTDREQTWNLLRGCQPWALLSSDFRGWFFSFWALKFLRQSALNDVSHRFWKQACVPCACWSIKTSKRADPVSVAATQLTSFYSC